MLTGARIMILLVAGIPCMEPHARYRWPSSRTWASSRPSRLLFPFSPRPIVFKLHYFETAMLPALLACCVLNTFPTEFNSFEEVTSWLSSSGSFLSQPSHLRGSQYLKSPLFLETCFIENPINQHEPRPILTMWVRLFWTCVMQPSNVENVTGSK